MIQVRLITALDEDLVKRMAVLEEFLLKGKHGRPLDLRLFRECLDTGFLVGAWNTDCMDVHGSDPICEEVLVGMCYAFIHQTISRRVMVYEELVVHPDFRGRGVGDKIDEFLITLARYRGADCIEGTMPIGNEPVRRVHLRNGFSIREQVAFRLILNHFR